MRHTPEAIAEAVKNCLQSGSQADSEGFVHATRGIIEASIGRALRQWNSFDSAVAEDLVQEVYVILCDRGYAVLRSLRSDRPEALVAYLKTIAASAAVDHLRTRAAQKRGSDRAAESIEAVGHLVPAADCEADLHRGILLRQVDRCLKSNTEVSDRDRQIFWLYYRQGLSSRAISGFTLGLTQKGVESAIHRMVRAVRRCIAGSPKEIRSDFRQGRKMSE